MGIRGPVARSSPWRLSPEQIGDAYRLVAAFLAVNAPYWIAAHWFFMSRPWLNVDLLLPLCIAPLSSWGAAFLLVCFAALDVSVSQSATYHFSSPLEFLRAAKFATEISFTDLASATVVFASLFGMLCILLAVRLLKKRRDAWKYAIVVALLVTLLDVSNGSSMLSPQSVRLIPGNIAGSPAVTLLVRARNAARRGVYGLASAPLMQKTVDIVAWAKANSHSSIIFVLVESLGVHKDPEIRRWLERQVSIPDRFALKSGVVAFAGATTSAELRELCGLGGSYRDLPVSNDGCLPSRLIGMGWSTVGIHGFSGRMFDRTLWWPEIGLQRHLFAEDLFSSGQRICGGAFSGICDDDVVRRAVLEAEAGPRRFVYALTLNSHLPLADQPIPTELQAICDRAETGHEVCLLTSVIGKMLAALRAELQKSEATPLVVLVGDHAPPFTRVSARAQYSQVEVPALILFPEKPAKRRQD